MPSDGLVLTFDDVAYSATLGRTAKFPHDSIAFKWQDELAETAAGKLDGSASLIPARLTQLPFLMLLN